MCHRISASEAVMWPAWVVFVFRTCTAKVTPIPTRRGAYSTYFRREGLFDPVSIVLALKRPERIQAISLRLMGGDSQRDASGERIERCGFIPLLSPRLCDGDDETWDIRILMQAFYSHTWSIQAGSGRSKRVWHRQDRRVVLRQAWVGDRQT